MKTTSNICLLGLYILQLDLKQNSNSINKEPDLKR